MTVICLPFFCKTYEKIYEKTEKLRKFSSKAFFMKVHVPIGKIKLNLEFALVLEMFWPTIDVARKFILFASSVHSELCLCFPYRERSLYV